VYIVDVKVMKSRYKELGVSKSLKNSLFIPELFESDSASTEIV
jgi:hypothetical protein